MTRDPARALALIAAHGRTSTAFQALANGVQHWFDDAGSLGNDLGMVAYADTGGAWVAAGEPIAPADRAIATAERWLAAAKQQGRRVALFATEGNLSASPTFRRMLIGEQPVWDPQRWEQNVRGHRSLREQLRRARAKGVIVRELHGADLERDPALRTGIERVVEQWLAGRPMARMGFLVDVEPLRNLEQRQLFIAERHGVTVALLSLAPVPARSGWLFEHLLREPNAPNGTAELLFDHAMRALANQGALWASLGLAPLAGDIAGPLRAARWLSRPFFNFRGLTAFKRRLRPDSWAPIYLAYPREAGSVRAMLDGLRAFAGRPLLSFALLTALRGPRPLLRALELLLVPWTMALAVVPSSPWFPSSLVHWAWVGFDLLLLAALRLLRLHPSTGLARGIAAAVSLDALLTVMQAAMWTIPMMSQTGRATTLSWTAVLLAVTGPTIAAPVLWGAARRHARLGLVRRSVLPRREGAPATG